MEIANITSSVAQDLTGKAILFEVGANAGILDIIESNEKVTAEILSQQLNINKEFIQTFLETFENIGLLINNSENQLDKHVYSKSNCYHEEKNKVGYILWGMVSCAPLIANTQAFMSNFGSAIQTHHRSGEHVARTSKWMGEKDFYPHAEKTILTLKPKKVIDLGSGTCGLLIRLAKKISDMQGLGIDISSEACEKAKLLIQKEQLEDRINVVVSPIQRLIDNNELLANADVVHAGFVFHDLLPEEENTLDSLLHTIKKASPRVTIVVVDAIPFAKQSYECSFSNAFSFLHKFFMGRKFLSEKEWIKKLNECGFKNVEVKSLGISGGRIFIANDII